MSERGCLYLVPTPIGNLDDITYRAITTLKEVDIIACEDTRVTMKLCRRFQIETQLVSYHEHNKRMQGKRLLQLLEEGKNIALVSDAGTPAISDPGSELVKACIEKDIKVVPLPGPNAAITALIASGLYERHFYFYGFLPRQKKERNKELERLTFIRDPIIFYEAPHRLMDTLEAMLNIFGNRKAVLARELTKRYEEFIRGTLKQLYDWTQAHEVRGEFCLIVEGGQNEQLRESNWWESLSIIEHVDHYITNENLSVKEAAKRVASERDMPKREVYRMYHENEKA